MMPNMAFAPTRARRTASSTCAGWWSWPGHTEGLLNALILLYAEDRVLLAPDSQSLETALLVLDGPGGQEVGHVCQL